MSNRVYSPQLWNDVHRALHLNAGMVPSQLLMEMMAANLKEQLKLGVLMRDLADQHPDMKALILELHDLGVEMAYMCNKTITAINGIEPRYNEIEALIEQGFAKEARK